MHNNNPFDGTTNKVYINPNFNKPANNHYTNASVMHVNPRFSHLISNVQPIPHSKPRVFVNPNFMKPISAANVFAASTDFVQQTSVLYNTSTVYIQEQSKQESGRNDIPPIAKSRYCLIRQNIPTELSATAVSNGATSVPNVAITTPNDSTAIVEKTKSTYQVNKYKSIPLKDIKKGLDNAKNAMNLQSSKAVWIKTTDAISTNKKYLSSTSSNPRSNQFKIVNRYVAPVVRIDKLKNKIDKRKKLDTSQIRLIKIKGSLKKNNIPCPTYRKFGKCLRQTRGKCEFLHDKKHVSICRKFIKGLCHDKDCLLSHDLTAKNMPTCYFYLQGTCTKPDCPYLHVKLNDKVKICPDFLKGYCEKGSKCLQRHIQPKIQVKDSLARKSLTSKRNNKIKGNNVNQNKAETQGNENSLVTGIKENTECRYYQDHKAEASASPERCEVIKPMRCKLGTLPSFIQL